MAPVFPADVLTAQRAPARRSGQRLAAHGPHEAVFGESLVGEVIGERSVGCVEIGIVVTVVGTGVDRLRVTIRQLLNLDVVEGRQRCRLILLRFYGDYERE